MGSYKFDDVVSGFEAFLKEDAWSKIIQWTYYDPDAASKIDFPKTGLYRDLQYVREYAIDKQFDLTDTGFKITDDGFCIPPKELHLAVERLYSFWHKCLQHTNEIKQKKLSDAQRKSSVFILELVSRFRLDFGATFSVQLSDKHNYYFTYSDISLLSGSSREVLRNKLSELKIETVPQKGNNFFADINSFYGYSELESFYINFVKKVETNVLLSHSNAQYFLTTLRGYTPTVFTLYVNGKNIIPNLNDQATRDYIKKRLMIQVINAVKDSSDKKFAEKLSVNQKMVDNIKAGKPLKIPFSLLVKIDNALFHGRRADQNYIPFSIIKYTPDED